MNYRETIEYLYNSVPMFQRVGASAYKAGLDNTEALDSHFGHPHLRYKTIHIAGTNGKGSCSHTIAAILQAAGYKVGLYTSPHLKDFRERIRVNGQCASEEFVVDFVEKERSFFEPLRPSFFELTTAMAFKYFAEQGVDIAVVEVGLGGRLDCTNIITPILSVITNISFDHTQFLGDTLGKIAAEKAGIIKHGVPVVIGESVPETEAVFKAKAAQEQSDIIFAEKEMEVTDCRISDQGGLIYSTKSYGTLYGELSGIYQKKNANTVMCALNILKKKGIDISSDDVRNGFGNVTHSTGLLGRWQTIQQQPHVVCDTGHNLGGWQYLSQQISMQKCRQLRIVIGMVDDKDVDGVMALLPHSAIYYFTKAETKRAISEQVMKAKGEAHGLEGQCYTDVPAAYRQAQADADADDFVFIGGSSYVVADLLTYLDKTKH